ncbi:MAG: hypothetical protein NC203_03765 [Firmicutes bacterium]|nr:hypothetical protein [[Eubacterium] siraeum]MCM1487464.1 hypothetical protein [Bacillota bacterium]
MNIKVFDAICENAVLRPEKNKELLGRKGAQISLTAFDKRFKDVILGKNNTKRGVKK